MKVVSFPPGISPNLLIFSLLIWQIEVLVSIVSEINSVLQRKCSSLGAAVAYGSAIGVKSRSFYN